MDEKFCNEVCGDCTAACPPPGVECGILKRAEKQKWLKENALPPMLLDESVRIDRAVNRDAFGITYEGFDLQTGKPAVIREYLPFGERGENHRVCHQYPYEQKKFAEGLSRTGRKLAALAKIRHPGLAHCYAMIQENGTLYALYEPVEGRTLEEVWNAIPVIEPKQAAVLFKPVAEALQAIIDSDIEPDEISPQNIIVKNEDGLCVMAYMGTAWPEDRGAWYAPAPGSYLVYEPGVDFPPEDPDHPFRIPDKDLQYMLCAMLYRWLAGEKLKPGARITPSSFPLHFPVLSQDVLKTGLSYSAYDRFDSINELWTLFELAATHDFAPVSRPEPKAEAEPKELEAALPVPATTFEPEEKPEPELAPLLKGALAPGTRIGETVKVCSAIKRTSFGFHYLGRDEETGKDVIICEYAPRFCERAENGMDITVLAGLEKVIAKDKWQKTLSRLMEVQHPGMARLCAIIEGNNTFYTITEAMESVSLPELWENRTYTPEELFARFTPAVEAILLLRQKGLLAQLKPQNFAMKTSDGSIFLKEIDSTFPGERISYYNETSAITQPVAYEWHVPPDLMREYYSVDKAMQYTLCAVLYRMMTANKIPSWKDRCYSPVAAELCGTGFSEAVDAVLAKGLSLKPDDRYKSIAKLWEAFLKAIPGPEESKEEERSTSPAFEPEERPRRCFHCMEKVPSYGECPHCGHDNAETLEVGKVLSGVLLADRYRTGRKLGLNGEYMTYIGYDYLKGQKVAIREFFPANCANRAEDGVFIRPWQGEEAEYRMQFSQRSRENAALIKDGRIAGVETIYDLFCENGTFYVIKEYVEGIPFQEWLKRKQTFLTLEEAQSVLRPAAEALVRLHEKGLAHGDIRPQNLMVDADGRNCVWIDRTLLCRHNEEEKSGLPPIWHSRAYVSPESWNPKNDVPAALSDEYAFCAVLYDALTGKPPIEALERMLSGKPLSSICKINATVSPEVEQVIFRGLEPKAENRWPSMQEWLNAMDKACALRGSDPKTSFWQKLSFRKGKK